MSDLAPVRLQKTDSRELLIEWNDGLTQLIPFRSLRNGCQCATCMDKRMQDQKDKNKGTLPVLSAAEAKPLDIEKMHPVGNYAYNIQFSDGHNTGIFTFELLRLLSPGGND